MVRGHTAPGNSFGAAGGYMRSARQRSRVPTLVNGLVGGVVAGVLTAAGAALLGASPSRTATTLARRRGDDPADHRPVALAAHVGYGGAAGLGLAALELYVLDLWSVPVGVTAALPVAVAWTAVLAVATVAWWALVGADVDTGLLGRVVVAHLALGVLLGLWVGLTG